MDKNDYDYDYDYDRWFALENWQASSQFNLARELKKTKNVLNRSKK